MSMIKLFLTGEGGQGVQTIAKIVSSAGVESGFNVTYIPSFGVEQRGTPSSAFIIISQGEINYPRFDIADYAVILQKRAIPVANKYISPNTKVIFDSSVISSDDLPRNSVQIFGTPATKYAYEKFTPRAFNILILGKLTKLLDLDARKTWDAVEKTLLKKLKDEKLRLANEEAFEFGQELVFETKDFTEPTFIPSKKKFISKGFGKNALILPERCKGCGICIEKCPVKALKFGETLGVYATPIPDIDLEKCIACGNCFRFCPDGAIAVEKEKKPENNQ